jgi:hypothetical protein
MSRLFTFGCSFTHWPWPTWSNIIAHELAIPYQNWGFSGIGNVGIHSRLLECDIRNKFTEDDIILVVWSSWTREDRYDVKQTRYSNFGWSVTGDVLHSYDKAFIDNYWSMNNDIVKNSTAIISANKMFDIKFNGHISMPVSSLYDDPALRFMHREKQLALFYEPYIPNDGIYKEKHPCRYTKTKDTHPDILSHLDYVQEYLAPKLNLTLSNTTVDFFTEMHYTLLDFTENTMDTSDDVAYQRKIPELLEKFNWKHEDIKGF